MEQDNTESTLISYTYRLLGRRDYSRHELRQKLATKIKFLSAKQQLTKDSIEQLVEKVLDYFEKEQLQSDAKFTAAYIRHSISKGWGPIKIKYKLQQRGVAGDVIAAEMQQDDDFWKDKVLEIITNKYNPPFANLDDQSKCQRFLMSRGFISGHIMQVLRDMHKESRG